MEPTVVALALGLPALTLLAIGAGWGARAYAAHHEVALLRSLLDAAAALAASRLDALNEAKALLVSRSRLAQEDVDRARALDEAVAGAPPGDELAAVERLLQARAGARREGPSEPSREALPEGNGRGPEGVDG